MRPVRSFRCLLIVVCSRRDTPPPDLHAEPPPLAIDPSASQVIANKVMRNDGNTFIHRHSRECRVLRSRQPFVNLSSGRNSPTPRVLPIPLSIFSRIPRILVNREIRRSPQKTYKTSGFYRRGSAEKEALSSDIRWTDFFSPFTLGAQQAAIARFCAEYGHEVVETLVEKETGKGFDAVAVWSAGLSAFSASGRSSVDSD